MKKTKKFKFKIITALFTIILCFSFVIIPVSAKTEKVIIGGEPFGLKLYCHGVMITGFEEFESKSKKICPAKQAGLQLNDVITDIDSHKTVTNDEITDIILKSRGKEMNVKFLRDGKVSETKLTPKKTQSGKYCVGMWVRDSCAGIGTISYYSSENKTYGALGHGICDIDTGGLMENSSGEIIKASISGVTGSENNSIGTLNGYFTDTAAGTIEKNTPLGIFGSAVNIPEKELTEVCPMQDVKKGTATLYTTIEGSEPKPYTVEILEICNYDKSSNRNFTIRVLDYALLKKAGGIVQGMSGSPIIQDGKLVGILTHVFLESCGMGYGIFADVMINHN